MKQLVRLLGLWLVFVMVLGLAGIALAQEAGAIPTDLSEWFVDTASLAAVIIAVTAFVRKHLWATLDGLAVVAVDITLGAALGLLGSLLGYVEGGVSAGLLFGAGAGLGAAGGVDGLRAIFGGGSGGADVAEANTTAVAAARSRLR